MAQIALDMEVELFQQPIMQFTNVFPLCHLPFDFFHGGILLYQC